MASRWKATALAIVLTAATAAGLATAYPAAAALACPTCLGFEKASGRVYVEDGMRLQEQVAVLHTVAMARDRLRGFYGTTQSDPEIFVCGDSCDWLLLTKLSR
jgi:hypothetical protein